VKGQKKRPKVSPANTLLLIWGVLLGGKHLQSCGSIDIKGGKFDSVGAKTRPKSLTSFHPEMALFRDLGVNLRDSLCDVPNVRLRAIS
jgi:hypothetical protein